MESFQQFPKGTKYIYGLNFYDGESGLEQTVSEATTAYREIGSHIYAFEIGNEVDGMYIFWANATVIHILTLHLQDFNAAATVAVIGPSPAMLLSSRSTLRRL